MAAASPQALSGLNSLVSTLESPLPSLETGVTSYVISLLPALAADQITIFIAAIKQVIASRANNETWGEALSDALDVVEIDEENEANTKLLALLNQVVAWADAFEGAL